MPGRPKPTSASDAAVEQQPSSLPSPVLRSHAGHTCAVSIKRQPCASVNSPPTFSLKQFYLVLVTLKFLSVQWALSRRWPNPKPPIPTCSTRPIHVPVSSGTTATGPGVRMGTYHATMSVAANVALQGPAPTGNRSVVCAKASPARATQAQHANRNIRVSPPRPRAVSPQPPGPAL